MHIATNMMKPETSPSELNDSLSHRLEIWSQSRITGGLVIESAELRWQLYFFMGRLSWACGGRHPYRRWQRLLKQYCPDWYQKLQESQSSDDYCEIGQEHRLLVTWINQHKITGEQATGLTRGLLAEILFDIMQFDEIQTLSYKDDLDVNVTNFLTLLNPEQLLFQAKFAWKKWKNSGLSKLSPDLSPKVCQPDALQASLPAPVFQKLYRVLNGQRSLRDVAQYLQQDIVLLVRSLAPYIRNKQIELINVGDLVPRVRAVASPAPTPSLVNQGVPAVSDLLVVGIDDSYLEKQILERYVRGFGCRFIGIEDPIQALPLLLDHQPDIIFLDLVMPIANGYEICSQIRKISKLKDTPVVILTGNDGIVDRVRAKLVGATDFLGKPVEAAQVEQMLQRHLPRFSSLPRHPLQGTTPPSLVLEY